MKYLLIAALWTGYCVIHSYLISLKVTTQMNRVLKKYYAFYRLFYVLISLALLIPLINYSAHMDTEVIISYGPTLTIIRYVLIFCSLTMFFWAFFFNYDSLSFFGIRQIFNLGKTKDVNPSVSLKSSGLLGIMRHPMYFALIIYVWCQTFTITDLVVNAVLTIYIFIGTRLEEKKLLLEFGDTYVTYQQEVPMLIPFTKARTNL